MGRDRILIITVQWHEHAGVHAPVDDFAVPFGRRRVACLEVTLGGLGVGHAHAGSADRRPLIAGIVLGCQEYREVVGVGPDRRLLLLRGGDQAIPLAQPRAVQRGYHRCDALAAALELLGTPRYHRAVQVDDVYRVTSVQAYQRTHRAATVRACECHWDGGPTHAQHLDAIDSWRCAAARAGDYSDSVAPSGQSGGQVVHRRAHSAPAGWIFG